MTSEFWIGVFVGVVAVTAIEFFIALMWAITARSSQISRWDETRDEIIDEMVSTGEVFVEVSREEERTLDYKVVVPEDGDLKTFIEKECEVIIDDFDSE